MRVNEQTFWVIRYCMAAACAGIATLTDIRKGRVPNRLICAGFAGALVIHAAEICCMWPAGSGDPGFAEGFTGSLFQEAVSFVSGVLLPLLFPGILFVTGMMGAGDIKLFSVIGAFLGGRAVLRTVFLAFCFGAVQSVFLLVRRRNAWQRFRVLSLYLKKCTRQRRVLSYTGSGCGKESGDGQGDAGEEDTGGRMHFTVSILAAVIWNGIPVLLPACR